MKHHHDEIIMKEDTISFFSLIHSRMYVLYTYILFLAFIVNKWQDQNICWLYSSHRCVSCEAPAVNGQRPWSVVAVGRFKAPSPCMAPGVHCVHLAPSSDPSSKDTRVADRWSTGRWAPIANRQKGPYEAMRSCLSLVGTRGLSPSLQSPTPPSEEQVCAK